MRYIYQNRDWPEFAWDWSSLSTQLGEVRFRQGHLLGRIAIFGFRVREEASLDALTEEVQKSTEIEGEQLDRTQIRFSIARQLGIDIGALPPTDRSVDGVVEMMLDATRNFDAPLTDERLFAWHAALFPTGYSGMQSIRVAGWRDDSAGAMQVVSGPIGRKRVHYEAPAASDIAAHMTAFLAWFEDRENCDPLLKAGLAHLWFVTIHPFEDGNGRIGRAIAEMALARSEKSPQRFYSMSAQIRKERKAYYDILENTQKGEMDVTLWMRWFLNCLDHALQDAESVLNIVSTKARFWERLIGVSLNARQRLMLNKMLDGFQGKLTSTKWAVIAKCSQDTAHRDIVDLIEKGALSQDESAGRSTSYSLNIA